MTYNQHLKFQSFNSRPHARGDYLVGVNLCHIMLVSIHAPTQGATIDFQLLPRGRMCFNSRPHARGDLLSPRLFSGFSTFQFTPPRKGRLPLCCSAFRLTSFNSRPHARGDSKIVKACLRVVFQFTPPRKGRPSDVLCTSSSPLFQFTPPRKGRQCIYFNFQNVRCFNSRPHARGDV